MLREILRSFDLQRRVIGALIMREMYTRYGRDNIGFLWVVAEPVMFCAGVSVMWSLIKGGSEHNVAVIAFVVTGYNPLTLWRHCVSRGVKAFEANASLMFHRQVTTLDVILARWALEVCGSTTAFFLTAVGAVAMGYMDPPKDIALVYAGWCYVALFSLGCSMLVAGLSEMSDIVERVMVVMTYVSIPLSGAFTMVDWVPRGMQRYLLMSPSVHAFEMLRGGWFGPVIHAKYSFPFVTCTCVGVLVVGIGLVRMARKHILVI